jgi:hypothetical protein
MDSSFDRKSMSINMSFQSQPASMARQYCQIHMEMDFEQKELAIKAENIGNGP